MVRSICETVDFHGGRPWAVEVAVWDLVGRSLGEPLWRLLGGRSESLVAYASTGERLAAEERVARVKTWVADGPGGEAPIPSRGLAGDVEVVEAVRDAVGSGIEAWSTRTRGGACRGTSARHGTSRPRPRAHERSSAPTSTGWRSRSRRPTSTATRCSATDLHARGRGRDGATLHEVRELILRGGVDVVQPDVMLAGGIGGCRGSPLSRTLRAARSARNVDERGRHGREPACRAGGVEAARSSRCRSTRLPGVRTAGTGCSRSRSRSRPTARSVHPRALVWACRSISTPSSRTGSHERSRSACEPRCCVAWARR